MCTMQFNTCVFVFVCVCVCGPVPEAKIIWLLLHVYCQMQLKYMHVEYSKHNTCNTWCVTYTYMPYIESKCNTLLGDCVIVLH